MVPKKQLNKSFRVLATDYCSPPLNEVRKRTHVVFFVPDSRTKWETIYNLHKKIERFYDFYGYEIGMFSRN